VFLHISRRIGLTRVKEVSERKAGVHDIEKELTSLSNDRLVVHDSQGFEVGDDGKLHKVLEFIRARSEKTTGLASRLHAIW
jgi:hypothetical protein